MHCIYSLLSFARLFSGHCLVSPSSKAVVHCRCSAAGLLGPPASPAHFSGVVKPQDLLPLAAMTTVITAGTTAMMMTTAAAGTSAAGLPPPPEIPRIQFPLPPPYWDVVEQPNFWTWWICLKNYIYWVNAQCIPANQLASEYKNHLLFPLLGSEGTNHFACNPLVCQLATTTFADFLAEVKRFFQPCVNVLHAHYDFTTHWQK